MSDSEVTQLISEIRGVGHRLRVVNGVIKLTPCGGLTQGHRDRLAEHRDAVALELTHETVARVCLEAVAAISRKWGKGSPPVVSLSMELAQLAADQAMADVTPETLGDTLQAIARWREEWTG